MREEMGPPNSTWLMAGTFSCAREAAVGGGGGKGGRWSLAESAMTHGAASAARSARHRSRTLIASTAAVAESSSMSARSDASGAGSGAKTSVPMASAATHGDHAPDVRTDSSKRKLTGADASTLNDGTR